MEDAQMKELEGLMENYQKARYALSDFRKKERDAENDLRNASNAVGAFIAKAKYNIEEGDIVSYSKTTGEWKRKPVTKNYKIRVFGFSFSDENIILIGENVVSGGASGRDARVFIGENHCTFTSTEKSRRPK